MLDARLTEVSTLDPWNGMAAAMTGQMMLRAGAQTSTLKDQTHCVAAACPLKVRVLPVCRFAARFFYAFSSLVCRAPS